MTCKPEELRWLMEWAFVLTVVLIFVIAAAWRWAHAPYDKEDDHA